MSMFTIARECGRGIQLSRDGATWLSFAASPAFALMAWISANDVQAMICASGPDGLPIGGMPFMYLLMSLFHVPPWLRFVSARSRQITQAAKQNQGD
ncbi:hypothetical protein PSQ19_12770 [Devosia algicola]|uniref:Uncharacterized protein n=1 Tax=Devosia algicola TaxID=3026418 RepID=A0ABY7YKD5_9HYPH|nr:hypothetical protein [Devosia algicola]WDR01633.1 hypothetical protein PSQ19_12770 [Devosia algicola]